MLVPVHRSGVRGIFNKNFPDAHKVNQGEFPVLNSGQQSDFSFIEG
jgi:hypothetical protein